MPILAVDYGEVWDIVDACWDADVLERPIMSDVLAYLQIIQDRREEKMVEDCL